MHRSQGLLAAVPLCALILAPSAAGAVTQNELLVAARALGFIENSPKGDVQVGIVYSPASGRSSEEARALHKLIGNGLRVGAITLKPVLVPLNAAASADVRLFFLMSDIGSAAAAIADVTKTKRIPCVTTDIPQVRSGACMMGVRSEPKIEILVNRAGAQSSGVSFATVFRMMITEF